MVASAEESHTAGGWCHPQWLHVSYCLRFMRYSIQIRIPTVPNLNIRGLQIQCFSVFLIICNQTSFGLKQSLCVFKWGLTVIVGWTEGVVRHTPSRGEDDKVSNGHAWSCGFGSQHSKDRWILWEDWKIRSQVSSHINKFAICSLRKYSFILKLVFSLKRSPHGRRPRS